MVYGAALERRFTRKGIQGSNPCPSAIRLAKARSWQARRFENYPERSRRTKSIVPKRPVPLRTNIGWTSHPRSYLGEVKRIQVG